MVFHGLETVRPEGNILTSGENRIETQIAEERKKANKAP